jgi:hypothetical protein
VIKKFKLWFSLISLVSITNFISLPAQATSNDAITLESISAVSSTVLTGENIVMQLEVAVPTGYAWDPNVTALGGKISILLCPISRYSEISGVASCSFTGTSSSLYTLSNIGTVMSSTVGGFDIKTFNISGMINSGEINTFKLFRIRIPAGNIPDRNELHTYLRGQIFAQELGSDRTDIPAPTFINGDVNVVALTPTPTPTPTPTTTPTITATPSPTPSPTVSATPNPSASETVVNNSSSLSGSSSAIIRAIPVAIQPIAVEASGQIIKKTPNKNGDLTWQRSQEISGGSDWVQKNNRKASGGKFISTSNPQTKLNISTSGDAFTLRYMTGKNMGKIRVMVDGKKLAEFKTSSLTTKSKAKSWIGIGPGKHKIEIIPILDPGQSIGVDAFQVARAV